MLQNDEDDWENAPIPIIKNIDNTSDSNKIFLNDEDDWESDSNKIFLNDEKKKLERKLIEESDIELSKDLFGTKKIQNQDIIESNIPLKTKQDHENFAKKCSNKLKNSTSLHIKVFYKSLTNEISNRFSIEDLNLIVSQLQNIILEKKPNLKPKVKKEFKKNYDDVFGKAENIDIYDELYGDIQDKYDF